MKYLLIALVLFSSCTILELPLNSITILNQNQSLLVSVDSLFGKMEADAGSATVSFAPYANGYLLLQSKISTLQTQDSIRVKASVAFSQLQKLNGQFQVFANDHAAQPLNAASLSIHQQILDNSINAIILTEQQYK